MTFKVSYLAATLLLGMVAIPATPAVATPPAAEQGQTIGCIGEGSTLICMPFQDLLELLNQQSNGTSGPACGQLGQKRCPGEELW